MLPGHTKFAPNRFFGLFKQTFRRCKVETTMDSAQVVQSSMDKAVNIPQTIVNPVSQQQLIHVYQWSAFLDQFFKPILQILSYQVFYISSTKTGTYILQKHSSRPQEESFICKRIPESNYFPKEVPL